jgi:hypothetical protein
MIQWIIYFVIDLIFFSFFSNKVGLIGLVLIFLKIILDTGILKGIKFYKSIIKNSEIFYIEHVGEYNEIHKEMQKLDLIMKKFNLNELYSTFGIYYDDPDKVNPKDCRAVIGIIREKENEMRKSAILRDENLTDYLISNNFKKGILPDTEAVLATFKNNNPLCMMVGIKKFYAALKSGLKSEEFRKMYNIDRNKYKCSLEIYHSKYKEIHFLIPLKNHDKFNLHTRRISSPIK